jgi:hypothetical protein
MVNGIWNTMKEYRVFSDLIEYFISYVRSNDDSDADDDYDEDDDSIASTNTTSSFSAIGAAIETVHNLYNSLFAKKRHSFNFDGLELTINLLPNDDTTIEEFCLRKADLKTLCLQFWLGTCRQSI